MNVIVIIFIIGLVVGGWLWYNREIPHSVPITKFPDIEAKPRHHPSDGSTIKTKTENTMAPDTVSFFMTNGDFLDTICLPSAVGRTGGLSVFRYSEYNFEIETKNTNMWFPVTFDTQNSGIHFVADNGIWKWSPIPVAPNIISL